MLRRHARKVGVFIVGWLIVIGGLILVPLPGPGWAIVFVGLSLLATEFVWAARLKDWVQQKLRAWMEKVQIWRAKRRRRRLGVVDEAVDDVIDDVSTVAANAEDDSLMDVESLAAPRRRRRKDTGEGSIAS